MSEQMDKAQLLDKMRKSYAALEALLAPLSEEQMTTPGVNGAWSIKDNLAHIVVWQRYELNRQRAIREGVELPGKWAGLTVDESNERIYQENKARPLAQVLTELRTGHEQMIETVESMSNEALNRPIARLDGNAPWQYIAGNTYEHYREHGQIIQDWLASKA